MLDREELNVAELIRETRHQHQLLQVELAAQLGVFYHRVNHWENKRSSLLLLALKPIEVLLYLVREQGKDLLAKDFQL